MTPIIMSDFRIVGKSDSLPVSADQSVFDAEIPRETMVSEDAASEMRPDSGDMDCGVSGSGGLRAVESKRIRALGSEAAGMDLDGGNGVFEVGKSEMERAEVEAVGSAAEAEGLRFNGRSREASASSELGHEEIEIKTETRVSEDRVGHLPPYKGHCNAHDEAGCSMLRSEEVKPSPEIKKRTEADESDVNDEGLHFSGDSGNFGIGNAGTQNIAVRNDVEVVTEERDHDLNSSYSVFQDVSINTAPGALVLGAVRDLSYGFEYGDMVWGKVKSHPWWPGHIFNEAFASSSVRRTRREGHVLVAFFGDSSYGWFDPAELIPFEPYYAEKSRQTNSRNFMKAVEEAVDEASRRSALGLACRCRNPFNFRPASVPGYFVADVFDYEPGGVYSGKQIEKARDSVQPVEALSFVQRLALMPQDADHGSIDWIKNVATLLAYRKAVFEEFDETYAQAFGMEPVRPPRNIFGVLEQPDRIPPRAPLSGPLVIAEALGEQKSSGKSLKAKGSLKKDKYLFKRRDDPNEKRVAKQEFNHASQLQANVATSFTFKEVSGNFSAGDSTGDYVLQKRAPAVPAKHPIQTKLEQRVFSQEYETPGTKLDSVTSQGLVISPMVASVDVSMGQAPAHVLGLSIQGGSEEGKLPAESVTKATDASLELIGRMKLDETVLTKSRTADLGKSESLGMVDGAGRAIVPEVEAVLVEDNRQQDQVTGNSNVGRFSVFANEPLSSKVPGTSIGDVVVGKIKALKRPVGDDLNAGKFVMGEKKKKKKKDIGPEAGLDHQQKRMKIVKDVEVSRKSAGKSIGIGLVSQEHHLIGSERQDVISSISAPPFTKLDDVNVDLQLPQLVDDLLALALDPFHAIERNSPTIVRHVFLKFRSLVYQKSLVLQPVSESETSEPGASKSAMGRALRESSAGIAEVVSAVEGEMSPATNSLKPSSWLDDPARGGRKRGPSDRQEEMSAKRLKKLNNLKRLALEKKANGQKTLDLQKKVEQKETGTVAALKPARTDPVKKPEMPARVIKPTALVMKFPPVTPLPSAPELKARFARFGPLDLSGIRVYWKSATCRVVFKYRADALAAYNHAVRYNSLYGQVRVRYSLRDLELPASELPEVDKRLVDDGPDDASLSRPSSADIVGEPRPLVRQQWQPPVQLKSCLKKPSGDEVGPTVGMPRESPRVKFLLGGEDSRGEQMVVSSSNNGSSADGPSMAFDINIKNVKTVMVNPLLPSSVTLPSRNIDMPLPPPLPLPFIQTSRTPDVLPSPPSMPLHPPFSHALDLHESRGHFGKAPHPYYNEGEGRKENAVDISHQLLSLLLRCSDIVTDLKSALGYVPYHPL